MKVINSDIIWVILVYETLWNLYLFSDTDSTNIQLNH